MIIKDQDMDLIYKLGSQLDRETFFEVFPKVFRQNVSIENENMSLIALIEEYRKVNRITMRDFAPKFDISHQAYYTWVKKTKVVPAKHVKFCAQILGVSVEFASSRNFVDKEIVRGRK